jgi:hypothetical protein
LDDPHSQLLAQARTSWPTWQAEEPALAEVGGLDGLREWLRSAEPAEAEQVLRPLARLAAHDGGDDPAAAAAMALALLPGVRLVARRVAHCLHPASPRVDEVVAAQLWLEIRSFSWRTGERVAATVLQNTYWGALAECGHPHKRGDRPAAPVELLVEPRDPMWEAWAAAREPVVDDPQLAVTEGDSPVEELLGLLGWAEQQGVIGVGDRRLLVSLMAAAARTGSARASGRGGLMSASVSTAVASELGVAPSAVRRRALLSMRAISVASSDYLARTS